MKYLYALVLLFIAVSLVPKAQAQTPDPVLVNGTVSVTSEIRSNLEAWLASSPPSSAPYYAVTYYKNKTVFAFVSLVGLNLGSPDEDWSLEDGKAIWLGTVKLYPDGSVEQYSKNQHASGGQLLFRPKLVDGGGSYVLFPWMANRAVIYGPRAIHGDGDYGTSGMFAVDLVSGSDLGRSAAPDQAYASDAGTIDYVCTDGDDTAVRTHNDTTDDYFIYAHLVTNDNLAVDTDFARGALIGSLKHGTFSDDCGWAEQKDTHWHLHWMFTPANGAFQAEGCILTFSDKKWHCGTKVLGTGQWLIGGGGTSSGHDDPAGESGYSGGNANVESSLWDYMIVGLAFIIDPFFKLVPEHQGLNFVYTIYNTVDLFFRLLYVFFYGNINLLPLITIVLFIFGVKTVQFGFWIGAFILKAWKSLVPIFGA